MQQLKQIAWTAHQESTVRRDLRLIQATVTPVMSATVVKVIPHPSESLILWIMITASQDLVPKAISAQLAQVTQYHAQRVPTMIRSSRYCALNVPPQSSADKSVFLHQKDHVLAATFASEVLNMKSLKITILADHVIRVIIAQEVQNSHAQVDITLQS